MTQHIDGNSIGIRMAEGESIGEILLSTLTPAEQLSLARCAVVRFFDRELFDEYLCVREASFERLTEHGWIGPVGHARRWYCVAPHVRDDAWNSWWRDTAEAVPSVLADLADELANYYRDRSQPIEQLRHLVISRPAVAKRLFDAVYKKADEDFDLARCQDAVDALGEYGRAPFLSSELEERRGICQRRIWARSAWATDFLQTADAHFEPRKDAQGKLKHLLEAGSGGIWMLQLHGEGGIGKTMLLRHFVARVCATSRPLVACARIDGDAIDPAVLLDFPWLLLVEAAAQLNRQLPGGPFSELLNSSRAHRGLLRRMPQDAVPADISDRALTAAGEKVEGAFCRALEVVRGRTVSRARKATARVVIVLDTLDNIVELGRSAPQRLGGLVDMLNRVHDAAGRVRVVLAGRENLRRISGVVMPKDSVDVELKPFTEEEARYYLVHRREIAEPGKVAAIIRGCGGMPIFLAGLADEVDNDSKLTAEEIDHARQHLVNYMNDRVLKRINDPIVSWCLRFSVVPPALSYEFFRHVMLPELRAEGLDPDLLGDAARWSWDAQSTRGRYPVPSREQSEEIERLWHGIVENANKSRWMDSESSADQELVIVNTIVRAPLREDVREIPAFISLHVRAIKFYEDCLEGYRQRGGKPSIGWIRWQKEIIFHLFQLSYSNAAEKWRDAVRSAHDLGRPGWAGDLAEYVLGPDFHDVDGQPDRLRVSGQVLYEAHVERAFVMAQGAGRLPAGSSRVMGSVIWPDEAQAEVALADQELKAGQRPGGEVVPIGLETDLRALLAVDARRWEELAELDPVLAAWDGEGDYAGRTTLEAWLVRARALRFQPTDGDGSTKRAWEAYRRARDACRSRPECVKYVDDEVVEWLLDEDRPDFAYRWSEEWRLARHRAEALLALAMPDGALAALGERSSPRARCLAARAQLALHRPKDALGEFADERAAIYEFSDDEPGDVTLGADLVKVPIEQHLIKAEAYGMLFELDEAGRCLSDAQSLLDDADVVGKARVDTATALFELRVVGDIKNAKNHLDQEFDSLTEGSEEWTRLQLARAELADRQGRTVDMVEILQKVRSCLLDSGAPTRRRVEATMAGLAARSLPDEDRLSFLALLVDDLGEAIPDARLAMLTGLRRCRAVGKAGELAGRRLRELVTATADLDSPAVAPTGRDTACRELALAHLFRVIGDEHEYLQRRAKAWWTLKDDDPFIAWELLAADAEFGGFSYEADPDRFKDSYSDHPMLVARFIIESVAQRGDFAGASVLWLESAEHMLADIRGLNSVCGARLYEVQTTYAVSEPDSWHGADTAALSDKANAVWALLGDARRIKPTGKVFRYGEPGSPEPATVVQANVLETRIYSDRSGSGVCVGRWDDTQDEELFRWSDSLARKWPSESASQWGQVIGDPLSPGIRPLLPGEGSDQKLDVLVEFPSPKLAAYPWELAEVDGKHLASHRQVRVVRSIVGAYQGRREVLYQQRMLNALGIDVDIADGIVGPKYQAGIRELLRRYGRPGEEAPSQETWSRARDALRDRVAPDRMLNVLIVQPDVSGNLYLLRRSGERIKTLIRAYHSAFNRRAGRAHVGLAIRDMVGGEVASLLWPGSELPLVDVLHVCTVMEATEQMPVLGLDMRGGPPLDAAEVDQMVWLMTGADAAPPLVVLDVQAPPSPADVRRQLLMRNRFAHQLLELGNVDTVIATGLEMRRDVTVQWDILTEGLARQRNAAEICREIQQVALADTEHEEAEEAHLVANVGSALFTNVQPGILVEPGLLS